MAAGFEGPYRFVARLSGVPGLTNLGGFVQGTVRDPAHFALDFPESTFVTHYTRDGSTARAVIKGRTVTVEPGLDTAGTISPEDMLPGGLWAQIIAPWQSTLMPDGATGGYRSSGLLTDKAQAEGLLAASWRLLARTDGGGRLTSLSFSGRTWGQPFEINLQILYG